MGAKVWMCGAVLCRSPVLHTVGEGRLQSVEGPPARIEVGIDDDAAHLLPLGPAHDPSFAKADSEAFVESDSGHEGDEALGSRGEGEVA